jgi:hypothetical protein
MVSTAGDLFGGRVRRSRKCGDASARGAFRPHDPWCLA